MCGRQKGLIHTLTSPALPAAVRCPVSRTLLAPSAPALLLATMEVSSRPTRAPAAAHLAGWYEGWGLWGWGESLGTILWVVLNRAPRRGWALWALERFEGSGSGRTKRVLWPPGGGQAPGALSPSHPTGHHLLPALSGGLPWTQLLPGMSLSQRWPLRQIHWAVSLCSRLHRGSVSGTGKGGSRGVRARRGGSGQAHSARRPGAVRSAPWATSGRIVLRRATAPPAPAASQPTERVCANTASAGTAAPSASAPTASMASAARCRAPATRSTASGGLWDTGQGLGRPWETHSVLEPPGSHEKRLGHIQGQD